MEGKKWKMLPFLASSIIWVARAEIAWKPLLKEVLIKAFQKPGHECLQIGRSAKRQPGVSPCTGGGTQAPLCDLKIRRAHHSVTAN